jgi:hypothetical protein
MKPEGGHRLGPQLPDPGAADSDVGEGIPRRPPRAISADRRERFSPDPLAIPFDLLAIS